MWTIGNILSMSAIVHKPKMSPIADMSFGTGLRAGGAL